MLVVSIMVILFVISVVVRLSLLLLLLQLLLVVQGRVLVTIVNFRYLLSRSLFSEMSISVVV